MFARKSISIALAALSFLFLIKTEAVAQYGRSSLGIRLGNHIAVDYKQQTTARSGFNVSLGVLNPFSADKNYVHLTAAYHFNFVSSEKPVSAYIGAGFSTGAQFLADKEAGTGTDAKFFLSADVPIGIEFALVGKPVVFCIEWSPKVKFFAGKPEFLYHSLAAGIRFHLPIRR